MSTELLSFEYPSVLLFFFRFRTEIEGYLVILGNQQRTETEMNKTIRNQPNTVTEQQHQIEILESKLMAQNASKHYQLWKIENLERQLLEQNANNMEQNDTIASQRQGLSDF